MKFAVGIGLTNECNLRCAHCYRPDAVIDRLGVDQVRQVCESIPIRSMNLGVGENGIHPDYRVILAEFWKRRITTSITSNGLSVAVLPDDEVKRFHSVELSVDFPTEGEHDALRGAGNWRDVMRTLGRCAGLGVPVTITAVMMSTNYDRLAQLARVTASWGANLRVNVYQPAKNHRLTLTYEQLWHGFRALLGASRLVATTEPVLAAVLELDGSAGPGCGRSTVRVAPNGRILPCTYWPASNLGVDDLWRLGERIVDTPEFVAARQTPAACAQCPCRGGCAGRRVLMGRLNASDPYCPFIRGERIRIDWEPATIQVLPKLGSACTTVVSAT